MCGFAGILSYEAPLPGNTQGLLKAMGREIHHRGPDDEQFLITEQVGVVFKRLSINDLGGGHQPFYNEDRTLYMVVNGEIYNHQDLKKLLKQPHTFQGQSDCEVLMHLYEEQGLRMLDQVNGMFSVLLYDTVQQKVFLIRDRMGIKPLYYAPISGGLLVASEMKALWVHPQCPVEVDWISHWEHQGFNSSPNLPSFFQGIEYLQGGHYLEVSLKENKHTDHTYWNPNLLLADEYGDDSRSIEDIQEEYTALLSDAVKIRLMADVELGLFLSGGIDSVSVAAFASQEQSFHTFSVMSQSTFANGDSEMAHRAAQELGLPNHQVLYPHRGLPIVPEDWKHILWHTEMPRCEIEQLYKLYLHRYAKQIRPELKVILLGQGSDEFNGGYSYTFAESFGKQRELEPNWDTFMQALRYYEKHNLVRHATTPGLQQASGMHTLSFLQQQNPDIALTKHPFHFYWQRSFHNLQQYNLWHEDRTSMANEIESRVPFLDHRLVEFSLRIPRRHYPTLFWDKQVLRKGMEKHVPTYLAQREKVLFYHGNDVRYSNRMMFQLFAQDNYRMLQEALEGSPKIKETLDTQAVLQAFQNISEDPEHARIPTLLPILNMCLLQSMAERASVQSFSDTDDSPLKTSSGSPLHERKITDWDQELEALKQELALSDRKITENSVLQFVKGVVLLHSHHEPDIWKVEVDGELEYYLEESELKEWIAVLKEIDGERPLGDLLKATGLTLGTIQKSLEEAMDYHVVEVRPETEGS